MNWRKQKPAAQPSEQENPPAKSNSSKAGSSSLCAPKEDKQPNQEKRRARWSAYKNSPRFYHGRSAMLFTAGVLTALILINVVTGLLVERFPSLSLDLTAAGSNTLSDSLKEMARAVPNKTDIYILAKEEDVKNNLIYSEYGATYNQVGVLVHKLCEQNSQISATYVDLDKNPGFAQNYEDEELQIGQVIVQTEKRYRVLNADDLFSVGYDENNNVVASSTVDSALLTALYAVNTDELPIIAIATGHGEMLDTAACEQVWNQNGFETESFNLLTGDIPQDAGIVFLPTPSTDYTEDELQKLADYLNDEEAAQNRSLLAAFYPSQSQLPNLSAFLKEWGVEVRNEVVMESDSGKLISNDETYLLANYEAELDFGGKSDYGYLPMPQSRALQKTGTEEASVSVYSLLSSSNTSFAYPTDEIEEPTGNEEKESQILATLSQKERTVEGQSYRSSVAVFGSSVIFTTGIIDTSTFGSSEYLLDLFRYMTGTSDSKWSAELVSTAINTTDLILTNAQAGLIGVGGFIIFIPLAIFVIGAVVFVRRRNL